MTIHGDSLSCRQHQQLVDRARSARLAEWIQDVSWSESKVTVGLSRQSIKDAPVYDEDAPLDRDVELGLYQHYERDAYWQNDRAVRL